MKNAVHSFGSDNFSSVNPNILKFLLDINVHDHMLGYDVDITLFWII